MKRLVLLAFICVWGACTASAYMFKVKVDLGEKPVKDEIKLAVPKGAEKASERYLGLAEKTHPNLLSHGFAAIPEQPKTVDADDPLDDLEGGAVEDDAIQRVDKDVEYVVRMNGVRKSFVLLVVNRKDENLPAEIALKRGKMREPVYWRVYSEDGGKSWTTMAWQPPRESDIYPWTVEIPAKTVQTITIGLR